MSRSNNTEIVNPSTRWFSWSGSDGKIVYYDKQTKENVEVKMPFTFLLLEELSTITGYNESAKAGIYANEVKDLSTTPLRVMEGKREMVKGLYSAIKDTVTSAGGKYAKSCYIAYKNESGELVIGNFLFAGSSFGGGEHIVDKVKKFTEPVGGWLDFAQSNRAGIYTKAIRVTRDERICTKGKVSFYAPKFELIETSEETDKKAIELDKELQEYLAHYFQRNATALQQSSAPAPQGQESVVKADVNWPEPSGRSQARVEPEINETPWDSNPVDDLPF